MRIKLSELRKKVGKDMWGNDKLRYIFHPENNTLVCVWDGMLEPQSYKCQLTDAYKTACEKCGCNSLANSSTVYKDGEDGTVIVDIDRHVAIKWEIINVQSNNHGLTLFYDGNKVTIDDFLVSYCYSGGYWYEGIIGVWAEHLLVHLGENIYMISPSGTMKCISSYPAPESGREDHGKVIIRDDELIVSEYVYYDCDHHHGDWETEHFTLTAYRNNMSEYQEKREKYAKAGLDYAKTAKAVEAVDNALCRNRGIQEQINVAIPDAKSMLVTVCHKVGRNGDYRKATINGRNITSADALREYFENMVQTGEDTLDGIAL